MSYSLRAIWTELRGAPAFLMLCVTAALWNFSINVSGPFYTVYMSQDLKFTAATIGLASIATSLSRLLTQRKLGEVSDRLGAAKVQIASMFMLPILPMAWLFITQAWQVIALNIFGGIIWGAFELASFNFLLHLIPPEQRARYSAIYQIVVTIALALGAAAGSSLVGATGYKAVFFVSGIGRLLTGFLFLFLWRSLEKKKQTA
jgi:MFS family permease